MSELKPCPFCGEKPEYAEGGTITSVWCNECGYEFAYASIRGDLSWIESWNYRPIENKLHTALKKAMEILLTDDERAKAELFLELKGLVDG